MKPHWIFLIASLVFLIMAWIAGDNKPAAGGCVGCFLLCIGTAAAYYTSDRDV